MPDVCVFVFGRVDLLPGPWRPVASQRATVPGSPTSHMPTTHANSLTITVCIYRRVRISGSITHMRDAFDH